MWGGWGGPLTPPTHAHARTHAHPASTSGLPPHTHTSQASPPLPPLPPPQLANSLIQEGDHTNIVSYLVAQVVDFILGLIQFATKVRLSRVAPHHSGPQRTTSHHTAPHTIHRTSHGTAPHTSHITVTSHITHHKARHGTANRKQHTAPHRTSHITRHRTHQTSNIERHRNAPRHPNRTVRAVHCTPSPPPRPPPPPTHTCLNLPCVYVPGSQPPTLLLPLCEPGQPRPPTLLLPLCEPGQPGPPTLLLPLCEPTSTCWLCPACSWPPTNHLALCSRCPNAPLPARLHHASTTPPPCTAPPPCTKRLDLSNLPAWRHMAPSPGHHAPTANHLATAFR